QEQSRFKSPLIGEEILPSQSIQAIEEINNDDYAPPYSVSQEVESDGNVEDFMIDVVPEPHSIRSGKSTEAMFHDVYIPSFGQIPESSPLKQFTATDGSQIADSYL